MRSAEPARNRRSASGFPAACLLLLSIGAVSASWAQETLLPVTGLVTDANQSAVVDYRVVFRAAGSDRVFISPATDDEGSYRLSVNTGVNLFPVAVISPLGKRIALEPMSPKLVMPGIRFDIELGITITPVVEPRPFPGADRLFAGVVEDVVFVERQRAQAEASVADYDDATGYTSEFLAAFNFFAVPRLELGARAGYAGTELDSSSTGAKGFTDLELWGKLRVHSSPRSGMRSAAGIVLTLPTGEPETGLAAGAAGAKLFAAVRYDVGRFTLSANGGLRFSGDTDVDGIERTGQVAGSLGIGVLTALGRQIVAVGELAFESARYEDAEDAGVLLVGANWKPLREGFFRLALGFGLTDGAPDTRLVGGYVFEF